MSDVSSYSDLDNYFEQFANLKSILETTSDIDTSLTIQSFNNMVVLNKPAKSKYILGGILAKDFHIPKKDEKIRLNSNHHASTYLRVLTLELLKTEEWVKYLGLDLSKIRNMTVHQYELVKHLIEEFKSEVDLFKKQKEEELKRKQQLGEHKNSTIPILPSSTY